MLGDLHPKVLHRSHGSCCWCLLGLDHLHYTIDLGDEHVNASVGFRLAALGCRLQHASRLASTSSTRRPRRSVRALQQPLRKAARCSVARSGISGLLWVESL